MKIFEPKRRKYRKKIDKVRSCEFCDAKKIKNQECEKLSGKHWMVMVNIFPYLDGNLMLVSKRHFRNVQDMNHEERAEFFIILERVIKKLGKIFKTEDFNVSLNIGKNAGASIEHMHWQVIPRNFKIQNATNIFADLHIMTILPEQLKKTLDK